MTRKVLSHVDVVKVHEAMKPLLIVDGEHCTYKDDWSDARIANRFGVPETAVARLRVNFFGKFKNDGPYHNLIYQLDGRVDELQKLVVHQATELQRQHTLINELILKHNNLAAELAMNRVLATTKHHEVKLPPRNGAQA